MSSYLNSFPIHESPWSTPSHFFSAIVKLCHSWGFPEAHHETRIWVPGIYLEGDPRNGLGKKGNPVKDVLMNELLWDKGLSLSGDS